MKNCVSLNHTNSNFTHQFLFLFFCKHSTSKHFRLFTVILQMNFYFCRLIQGEHSENDTNGTGDNRPHAGGERFH